MLTVLCPSRARPDNAAECYRSFIDTRHNPDSELYFVLDEDDSTAADYDVPIKLVERGRPGMTDALNTAARHAWNQSEIVGFVGDDHRFRSPGWDQVFIDQLAAAGGGLAYANDLNWQLGEIPTQIFGSSSIWKALGWMALPTAQHLYLDNAWRAIGDGLGRLFYFPDIVIEHLHPAFGKAEWDEGYRAVNSEAMYIHDRLAFNAWITNDLTEDLARVRLAAGF